MPAPVSTFYADVLFSAAFMIAGCVFWIVLAGWFRFRRRAARRDTLAATVCLILAIVFGVQAIFLGIVAYDQYRIQGEQHYSYQLLLSGNATFREGIVVPIPTDETLLTNLHVDSGDANWSLVDTVHGRGLYVSFMGFANLSAQFFEFSPSGRTRDDTPTLGNATSGCLRSAYFFLDGPRALYGNLFIDDCSLQAPAYPGWNSGDFNCCPPVAAL